MRYMRKMLATLLVVAMLISSLPLYADGITDIKGYWAEKEITKLQKEGLISGYSDGSFQPEKEITRAEFIVALNRMMGFTGEAPFSFTDVKADDWFAKALAVAIHNGYIKGYADGSFRPNAKVSRYEVAVMIARANKLFDKVKADDADLSAFADGGEVPHWAKSALSVVVKSGIMKGDLEKFFKGEKKMTRGEAVVSLSRARDVKQEIEIKEREEAKATLKEENNKQKDDKKEEIKKDKKEEAAKAETTATGGGGSAGGTTGGESAGGSDSTGSDSTGSDSTGGGGSTGGSSSDAGLSNSGSSAGSDDSSSSNGSVDTNAGQSNSMPQTNDAGSAQNSGSDPATEDGNQMGDNQADQGGETENQGQHSSDQAATEQGDTSSSAGTEGSGAGAEGSDTGAQGSGPESGGTEGGSSGADGAQTDKDQEGQSAGSNEAPVPTIDEFIQSVSSADYNNITRFTKDGEDRAILWVKGITTPRIHENGKRGDPTSDFIRYSGGENDEYIFKYRKGLGWYDVDKLKDQAKVLCSAAVATNMLYWWADQNGANITKFLAQNSEHGIVETAHEMSRDVRKLLSASGDNDSSKSALFDMWISYYSNTRGVWADTTQDFFLSGYKPDLTGGTTNHGKTYERDSRGGYFHQVFGSNLLTTRHDILYSTKPYALMSSTVKEALSSGKALGLSYVFGDNKSAHIVTVWGAEYNAKGEIKAVFITNSDDENAQMERMLVKQDDRWLRISTNIVNKSSGPRALDLYTLDLGTKHWDNYFQAQGGK